MAVCSHCGKELRPGDRFCQYCGQQIEAGDEMYAAQPSPVYVNASSTPHNWQGPQQQPSPAPSRVSTGPLGASGPVAVARLIVRVSPTAEPGAVVDDGEREFVLDGSDIYIGRAPSCDIVLAGDQLASRRHALLRGKDRNYTIVDLSSSNGTYINDEEIHAETPLKDGDRVTVGGHDLIFSTAPASPSASRPGIGPDAEEASPAGPLLETSPSMSIINLPPPGQEAATDASLAEPEQLQGVPDSSAPEAGTPAEVEGEAQAPESDEIAAAAGEEAHVSNDDLNDDIAAVETAADIPVPSSAEPTAAEPTAAEPTAAENELPARSPVPSGPLAGMSELESLRAQLAEVSMALARRADEEFRTAGRLRAALVEVRDQLAELLREHGSGSYGASSDGQDYSQLATIARQASDHPRHLDYLSSLADHASDIADALEARQPASGGSDDLLTSLEALQARLGETLG